MRTVLNAPARNERPEQASLPTSESERGACISSEVSSPVPTVAEVVRLYLQHSLADGVHSPDSHRERARGLGLFSAAYATLPADQLKAYHLTDWIAAHPSWRSNATKKGKADAVRACWQWAVDEERLPRNPFKKVKFQAPERRPDLPDDVLELVARLANKRFEAAVRFLRLTGCRVSELCRACWADVDLGRGVWVIPRHKTRRHTGRAKVVALVPEAVELLRTLMALAGAGRPDAAVVVAEPTPIARPIFLNNRGKPWTRRTLGQQLARLKKRHGIVEPATLHGIRHRFGSAGVAAGAPLKLIAAQLGHASVTTTERYYVDLANELDAVRRAAQLATGRRGECQ
jgi:integrase/recombinase XerC